MWTAEGHDVAAVEDLFHHRLVQRCAVAAGPLVAGGQLLVHRGQQGAGAAGEVGHAQVADGFRAGPVHAAQLGNGQAGQQRGGRGQRVEGGEVLAVGYQPLEDAARKVVGVVHAGGVHRLGRLAQLRERPGRAVRV